MSTYSNVSYDAKNYLKHRPSYPDSVYEYLRKYISIEDGQKLPMVLDLACGPGEATVGLLKHVGEKVVGVDPSEGMLSQARENLKQYDSRVDLIVGSDITVTTQFAKHSVDLLCAVEAAHWFVFPDFWQTAHYLLKPGGTLAIWSYYMFSFEGHPESAEIIRDFCLSPEKCGTYWGEGQSRLTTLYSELEPPSHLFEREERILNTFESPNPSSPFQIRRENLTVRDILSLLGTYSAYHSWREANPGKKDILEQTTEDLLTKTKLQLDSKITVNWETVLLLVKAKKLD